MVTYLGSLVQSCCGEGGTLQTSITGVCRECLHCLSHTGFVPGHRVCAFPVYTAQHLGCSAGEQSKAGPGCVPFPGLTCSGSGSRSSTKAQTRLGQRFVPFPGPSSSGNQVLCEQKLPRWGVRLITSPSQLLGFQGGSRCAHLRCVVCLFWGADLWL